MKVDQDKQNHLTEKHGSPNVLEDIAKERAKSVQEMASNFVQCRVESDGCTYCQRSDGTWVQVFCSD